ncbi:MAG: amidohydrolase family protein [Steroidobacteraceae bacterium]
MPTPSTPSADLVIEARWVLPIAGSTPALAHHAVAIEDGRIIAVGPAPRLAERFAARERLVRPHHALLPGLIDAHARAGTFLSPTGLRHGELRRSGAADRAPAGVADTPAEAQWETLSAAQRARDGATLAIAGMLLGGTTAFGTQGPDPEEIARVAARARVRASVGLPIAAERTAWAQDATAHLARAESLWDEYVSNPWVRFHFALDADAELGSSDALLARIRTVADELDARIALPLHRSAAEVHASRVRYGKSPLERLQALGLLRPGFIALYGNHLDASALDLVARTGVSIVACPRASLARGLGACPIPELLARGAAVALGTGSPAAALPLDLLAEARAAALLPGALGGESVPLAPEQALETATLAGARALGLDSAVGSIEPGKAADLIAVDLDSIECQSASSPAEAVLYAATRDRITDVWIDGRPRVLQGRLLAFDAEELSAIARRSGVALLGEDASVALSRTRTAGVAP